LAQSQPGRSSQLYQQAKRLFAEGKVEEAITLLDEDKLGQLDEAAKEAAESAVQPRLLKAQLFAVQLRFKDAEKVYPQAIEIDPTNLGVVNRDQRRMEKARKEYGEALQIRRELAQKNPERYQPDLALTLFNLGILDSDLHRMEDARKEYEEALDIRRRLAQANPETYLFRSGFGLIAFQLEFG
jgi:tetratricopeptide (TPR) repeat protein